MLNACRRVGLRHKCHSSAWSVAAASLAFVATLSVAPAAQCPTGKLTAPAPIPGDQFGRALAGDSNELVVGGNLSVRVFVLGDNGTPVNEMDDGWTLQSSLLSPDPLKSDDYGCSVWLEEDHLIVGARTAGGVFGFGNGAVHIYGRVANGPSPLDDTWNEEAEVQQPLGPGNPHGFGTAVCLSRDYAAIGAPGEHVGAPGFAGGTVHILLRIPAATDHDATDQWVEQTTVNGLDSSFAAFGRTLRLNGEHLVVGAPMGLGAVYHFWRDDMSTAADPTDDVWIEHARVMPADGTTGIGFGKALDFDGTLMAVGASSKAYLFRLNDNGTRQDFNDDFWTEEATLAPADGLFTNAYGSAVAVHESLALVGDYLKNEGDRFGATFVFRQADEGSSALDASWIQVVKLASPQAFAQKFGATLRLDGARAFVGETGNFSSLVADDAETGAVWPYAMAVPPWTFQDAALAGTGAPPCMMGSGSLEPGATTVVAMAHDLANAPTAVVVGLTALEGAFKGGVLVPEPDYIFGLATDPAGLIELTARWPAGAASGMTFYVQAWTVDPQAPAGFSATNGVRGVTP